MSRSEAADRPLRLLLINWQDRENPHAGGAEVHLHEIFGRLAACGHEVRAVVGGWAGAPPRVTLDGIAVHRAGGRHTFPLRVRAAVREELGRAPADVVIEDINKLPLCSPRWAPVQVVALVPHLFGGTAFREAAWPVAAAVWLAERAIPRAYRDVPFQAISEGTAEDLVARGIPRGQVRVIVPGIDHETFTRGDGERDVEPTVLYVGRLKRYKGLDIVLRAVARLRAGGRAVHFDIAGQGDDRGRLEGLVNRLGLGQVVRFLGWISEAEKVDRLRRAWVAVYPSPKEGWGIANVEAAACGTPVVASDSPGLRESVVDGITGYLVPHDDVESWAGRLGELLADRGAPDRLMEGCIEHAARFSWDRAAKETEAHLRRVLARP